MCVICSTVIPRNKEEPFIKPFICTKEMNMNNEIYNYYFMTNSIIKLFKNVKFLNYVNDLKKKELKKIHLNMNE